MTSMKNTFFAPEGAFAVSTACIMPNEEPSPMPKMMSAPAAITVRVTRLPPAASAYDAWPIRAYLNFTPLSTERAPWQYPPDCLNQFSSDADTTMPSVPVFDWSAASTPARYAPCCAWVMTLETRPFLTAPALASQTTTGTSNSSATVGPASL